MQATTNVLVTKQKFAMEPQKFCHKCFMLYLISYAIRILHIAHSLCYYLAICSSDTKRKDTILHGFSLYLSLLLKWYENTWNLELFHISIPCNPHYKS